MAIAVDTPTIFAAPGQPGSLVELKSRYDNFIGGEWIAPIDGALPPEPHACHGRAILRGRRLHPGGHRARARRGSRREGRLGPPVARRARRRA